VTFLQVWAAGYRHPAQLIDALRTKPAPHWGLYAQLVRALLDALLLYLPLALIGRQPSTPSYLTFVPTERYFSASLLLAPVFLLALWLLMGATLHVILRLGGWPSDVDQILNITGMAGLVVGAVLVVWDWLWVLAGWQNVVWLGISHLILALYAIAITALGFVRILGLPGWLAVLLNVLYMLLGEPLAAIFMRAPI
jgi:hypothetical protein